VTFLTFTLIVEARTLYHKSENLSYIQHPPYLGLRG